MQEDKTSVKLVPTWDSMDSGVIDLTEDEEEDSIEIEVRLPFQLPLVKHPGPSQCFTRLRS